MEFESKTYSLDDLRLRKEDLKPRLPKDWIQVEIKGEDYLQCVKSSQNLWANSKTGKYGSGMNNTEKDPFRVERLGCLGELGFGRLLGLKPDFSYRKGGDNKDFEFNGRSIDVKVSFKNTGYKLIYAVSESGYRVPLKSEIYVIGYLKGDYQRFNRAEIVYVGWTTRNTITKEPIVQATGGDHMVYKFPYYKLRSLSKLLNNNLY
jgi:hypothetical protein